MGTESTAGARVGGDDTVFSEKSLSTPSLEKPGANEKRPFSKKRLLVKVGFSAVVFLLLVALGELALHLMGYGNLEVYDPDPKL